MKLTLKHDYNSMSILNISDLKNNHFKNDFSISFTSWDKNYSIEYCQNKKEYIISNNKNDIKMYKTNLQEILYFIKRNIKPY